MTTRVFHLSLAGDPAAAVRYGLTLKAKCGVVWVPTIYGTRDEHPEIPDCLDCHRGEAAYVYRCYDDADRLLYVGSSKSPRTRLQSHKSSTWWWAQVARTRVIVFRDIDYARRRETAAIRTEAPLWNVRDQNFATVPLDTYRAWAQRAVEVEAPPGWLMRLRREAMKHHGAELGVTA